MNTSNNVAKSGLFFTGIADDLVQIAEWKYCSAISNWIEYETTDLAKRTPEQLRRLTQLLQLHIQRGGQVPWQRSEAN